MHFCTVLHVKICKSSHLLSLHSQAIQIDADDHAGQDEVYNSTVESVEKSFRSTKGSARRSLRDSLQQLLPQADADEDAVSRNSSMHSSLKARLVEVDLRRLLITFRLGFF